MREDDFTTLEFNWFTGTVKDIKDPKKLNRVKVRAYGYHSADIATDKLPWATVMMPTTSASYKGVGGNHHLEVGSWVVGFFRDGISAQDPIVMGSIATQEDGVLDIPTEAQLADPTNKVYKSNAGHLIEIDNTSGSERVQITHKSGSHILMKSDGTIEIKGNTTVVGKLHATGDISTEAGNSPTLATHVHEEIPGTGGSASPSPTTIMTSKPFAGGTTVTYQTDSEGNEIPGTRTVNPPSG